MYMPKATPNAISPTMSAVNSEKTITKIIQPTVHLNRGPGCMCFTAIYMVIAATPAVTMTYRMMSAVLLLLRLSAVTA